MKFQTQVHTTTREPRTIANKETDKLETPHIEGGNNERARKNHKQGHKPETPELERADN